jgi:transposase
MRREKPLKYHLEIQRYKGNYAGLIRTSFREEGKLKHTSHGRLTGMTLEELKVVQAALRGDVVIKSSSDAVTTKESKEFGASQALLKLARELELDRIIYSRPHEQWVKDALALIVGRVVYAGSKLHLSCLAKDSALWELSGVEGAVDVDSHCYEAMDRLLTRQQAIQKALARKHSTNGQLVLYDITSSYFEGEYAESDIVLFGYNRDGKKGHEQMVIGLICNEEGCPIGVEVFPGNTQDAQTVPEKIEEIQRTYGIAELIFVGDRGMITSANYEKVKDAPGLSTISALTHREIASLLERKVIQPELFDEKEIVEVIDPDAPSVRYCLCKNERVAAKEAKTRTALIERTTKALDAIVHAKRKSTPERIAARVGKILQKTRMGKFIDWEVEEGRLSYTIKDGKKSLEELLDGCYIIKSDVPPDRLDTQELVASYKKLALVEQAFRNLKTVKLEIRPVYHKKDHRIRCHVFICMLAYYLQWHMTKRLKPLFASDKKGKKRQWTFERVIERLKSIRREVVSTAGVPCKVVTEPDEDHRKILQLLKVSL